MDHDNSENVIPFARSERDSLHENMSDTELASLHLSLFAHPSVVQQPVDYIVRTAAENEQLHRLLASEPTPTIHSIRNNTTFNDQFVSVREKLETAQQKQALDIIEALHLASVASGQPTDPHLKVLIAGICNDLGSPDEPSTT